MGSSAARSRYRLAARDRRAAAPIARPDRAFERGEVGPACAGADDEFGALDRGIQIWRIDLQRMRLPAEGLERATCQIKNGSLLLIGGDIGKDTVES